MRRVENPPNPFVGTACEWLGPPPEAELTVYEEEARSILTANDSPDIPFGWSINPYRGCQHGCAYCYARRTHEYLGFGAGTDFDTKVVVKVNAPELLAAELSRKSWTRQQIAFSGVTDCYQLLETRYLLTRRCLEVCRDFANPVGIVTKAPLVLRDADLLAEIDRRCAARVLFSLTFADDAQARRIEPGAPAPSLRFIALRRLREAGVPVGVIVAPVIPGLNDREIPAILTRAAECGAMWASFSPIRLPGSVADVFLTRLRQELPDAADRVEARTRALRGGLLNNPVLGQRMEGHGAYWESIQRLFETVATRAGLNAGQRWSTCGPAVAPPEPKQMTLF